MSQAAYTTAEGNVVGSSPNLNLTIWFSRWRRTNEWNLSKTSSMNEMNDIKMYRMSFLTTKHVSGIFDQKKVARLKNWRFRRKKSDWDEQGEGKTTSGRWKLVETEIGRIQFLTKWLTPLLLVKCTI